MFGFHVPQYPQGHQATDYWRWIKSHGAYPVQYQVPACWGGGTGAEPPGPGAWRTPPEFTSCRPFAGSNVCHAVGLSAAVSNGGSIVPPVLQIGYEPYILMHRDYVPFYDERFRGYYWCVLWQYWRRPAALHPAASWP